MFIGLDIIGIKDEGQGFIIKEAVDLVAKELLPNNNDLILINVYVSDEVGDAMGLVCEEDEDDFSIILNEKILKDDVELFKTVCHEMVHVSQYVKKDLIHMPYGKYAWKGSIINDIEYDQRPWEIQAYQYEEKFAWQFVNSQQ